MECCKVDCCFFVGLLSPCGSVVVVDNGFCDRANRGSRELLYSKTRAGDDDFDISIYRFFKFRADNCAKMVRPSIRQANFDFSIFDFSTAEQTRP